MHPAIRTNLAPRHPDRPSPAPDRPSPAPDRPGPRHRTNLAPGIPTDPPRHPNRPAPRARTGHVTTGTSHGITGSCPLLRDRFTRTE